MARRTKTKVVAGLGVVAGALGLGAFNSSFDVTMQPEVTNEVFAPHFTFVVLKVKSLHHLIIMACSRLLYGIFINSNVRIGAQH